MTTSGPYATPPWGTEINGSGSRCGSPKLGVSSIPRPRTRTEMLRTRREEEALYARKKMIVQPSHGHVVVVPSDWWKLVEGYRENPMDDLASSPRFQRYMSRRARAHAAAERPNPFGTHEVRLRKPSGSGADKISNADPPPPDTEAYVAPKRTLKHFTDEFFEWKARLISHGDLDERGKSKNVTLDERQPPYSSLSSSFTGCTIDPKNNVRSARQAKEAFGVAASHPLEKPSAAEVARKAIKQRRTMWKAAAASNPRRKDDGVGDEYSSHSSNRPVSASPACSTNPSEAESCGEIQIRPPSAPPETNRRRYSRLCGQG